MAALNFPDSPNDGDEFSGYVYDSAKGVWNRLPTLPALDLVNFSAAAPSNPQDGQLWFDTTSSKMYVYYNDGSSAQWVSTIGGLASQTGSEGQFLIHDGTEWLASEFTSPGSVLQVVSSTKTDASTFSSTSYEDITGLSVSITPSSTSSKILVMLDVKIGVDSVAGYPNIKLMRDNTDIAIGDAAGSRTRVTWGTYGPDNSSAGSLGDKGPMYPVQTTYLDSPSSTSSLTYKLVGRGRPDQAKNLFINRGWGDADSSTSFRTFSSITVMEVAG